MTTYNTSFFDFLSMADASESLDVDLSKLLDSEDYYTESFFGYYGTTTTPDCTDKNCYYIMWNPYYITEEQYAFFTGSQYGPNARVNNLGKAPSFLMQADSIFGTQVDPHAVPNV